jgi:hypothetical protein
MKAKQNKKQQQNKKQHFVPQCYLRAWCDPETPVDQEPYVWRFSKDGSDARRKAPENIFHETDLYTITMPDRGRDLRLERGLSQLEGEFVKIRDSTLAREQPFEAREHAVLCTFADASRVRTPTNRDHLADMWGQLLAKADNMIEWAKTAPPEQRRAADSLPRSGNDEGRSFSYEEVKTLATTPLQTSLSVMVAAEAKLLSRLQMIVLTTSEATPFITSDNPCVVFDPEACKRPPMYQGVGLGFRSVQVTLPVSPTQLLLLRHGPPASAYVRVSEPVVDDLNRLTRAHCTEYFVTNGNTTRPIWFDLGEEPEDSWRKLHPQPEVRSEPT